MIKKTILLLSSFALFSCAPNPPQGKSPQSIAYQFELIEEELQQDSLLQMRFNIEGISIDSAYPSSESLEKKIQQRLLSNNSNSEGNYLNYTDLILKMKAEYENLNQEKELAQSWEISQDLEVKLNQNGLFGLQSTHFSYTGGAHGNTFIDNQTYSLDKGTLLALDSLLKLDEKPAFIAFCESKFREEREIGGQESLDAHGFWFEKDSFRISDNYSYSKQGLELIYNSYEIAPYAYGTIKITLSSSEIEPFIKAKYLLR